MLSGSCAVTAPGEYGIAGAVQGQHFCNLEWVGHYPTLSLFSSTL
jgi:hypothetical protein